jgi:hypothetical protein
MTEAEWLASTDVEPMLRHFQKKPHKLSPRQERLFCCSCCRSIWDLIVDERSREAVKVAERYAERLATVEELTTAHDQALRANRRGRDIVTEANAWRKGTLVSLVIMRCAGEVCEAASRITKPATGKVCASAARCTILKAAPPGLTRSAASHAEALVMLDAAEAVLRGSTQVVAGQAALLRHFAGNPFQVAPVVAHMPSTIVQLADSLHAGQDCAFALHDALLEAGHGELAEHFRQEQSHPKGCWVLDLLLGKS